MLSTALVIFREVFEIVLIVGIVLAATQGIPHRKKAIYVGFVCGIAGSIIVALFTGKISDFAEGMGQEYFNAGILFAAAIFIGWTLLWMKRHGCEMKAHFSRIGQDVAEGNLPFISLSAVIALAILREGSEIALFSYGMIAAGQTMPSILTGAAIGLAGGLVFGILFYMGLIKLSTSHFFRITGWVLMLLVAGMMSQAVGFLSAVGVFENLSGIVWNSSWLLDEGSMLGQTLHTLIGYTARPTTIQLITYLLTLGTLIMLLKLIDKKTNVQNVATALLIAGLSFITLSPSEAHATKKVYTPYVEAGELELEYRGGYDFDDDSDVDGAWKQKLAVGYGVNDFWFTEIYGEFEKEGESGADPEFTAIEWENRFLLSEPGEYWLDFGFLTELVYNTTGGADKAEVKGLFAKDAGKFSHTANLALEREFGEDAVDETEWGAAWSSRYRYKPEFEPGFEIHSDFGSISDGQSYDEQKHYVGPVFYGKVGHLKYDAGYLIGASDAAADGMLKILLEYEWSF